MFEKIKNLFKKPEPEAPAVKTEKKKKEPPKLSPKEIATQNNEPYINILSMDIDPEDVNNGAFELDWNDKFILNLIRAGYKQKDSDTDEVLVDRWFQTVCRNIALEVYEQQQADPTNRDLRVVRTKNLGGGRTEVS